MMTLTIKQQIALIYDGNPWYGGSITHVLGSVNPKHIFDFPRRDLHSIAELVAHIIAYRKFAENRLGGSTETPPDQLQTFDWKIISGKKKNFLAAAIDELNTNQKNLCRLLDDAEDALADEIVPERIIHFTIC